MAPNGVDSLYYQNLEEWVYDEKKLVTYHYLSVTLGVHINMAKQMLYDFYTEEKKKHEKSKKTDRKLMALFLVSGTECRADDEDSLKFTVTLCPDDKLHEHKKKLKSIFSVHIYSVQNEIVEDCLLKLNAAADKVNYLRNSEGQCGADFGPFKHIKPKTVSKIFTQGDVTRKEHVLVSASESDDQEDPTPNEAKKLKLEVAERKVLPRKKESKSFPPKSADFGPFKHIKPKTVSKTFMQDYVTRKEHVLVSASESDDQEDPTPKEAKKLELDVAERRVSPRKKESKSFPPKPADFGLFKHNKSETKESGKPGKARVSKTVSKTSMQDDGHMLRVTRKGQVLVSDSESDDPEDPTPKAAKKLKIEVTERRESPMKKESKSFSPRPADFGPVKHIKPETEENGKRGKTRVSKTVSKTFMQDDGYMLTVKEQVLVSASESDDQEDPTPKAAKKLKLEVAERRVSPRKKESKSVSPQPRKKAPKKLFNSNSQDSKMKQQSLTQFFKKM